MKLYKLTDLNQKTQNNTLWGALITHTKPTIEHPELCSGDVLHAYKDLNLALLLNPIHAGLPEFLIWEAEGEVVAEDFGKAGCFNLTTISPIEAPKWYTEKRVEVALKFSILCAYEVLSEFEDKFPSDSRPRKAIESAEKVLAALLSGDAAAAYAADAAAYAAAYAAAAYAADAAAYAAAYAARAAYTAADAARTIDFAALAYQAVEYVTSYNN